MGGTGDPPVPSGHWPDGRERLLTWPRSHKKNWMSSLVPRGESPRGTGGSPVLPVRFAAILPVSSTVWYLMFGIYLVFAVWSLVFFP